MFGWFKKKPEPELDPVAKAIIDDMFASWDPTKPPIPLADIDLDGRPPHAAQPEVDEDAYNEDTLTEFPEFRHFMAMYPYTSQKVVDLKIKFYDAEEIAEREVRRDILRSGREMSEEDKRFLIRARAIELALEEAMTADAIDLAERQGIDEAFNRHMERNQLDGIRNAIDRSAVAANAIDTMKAHPFLTGFLGAHVVSKLKG